MGEGAIGGSPGLRVPSVVCSAGAGAFGATLRFGAVRRAGRPAVRFAFAPVRARVPVRVAPARRLRVGRADDRLLAAAARLRRGRVVARPLRDDVLARFFRRVLLAIREPPLSAWTLSHGRPACARSFDGSGAFPFAGRAAPAQTSQTGASGAGPRWAVSMNSAPGGTRGRSFIGCDEETPRI